MNEVDEYYAKLLNSLNADEYAAIVRMISSLADRIRLQQRVALLEQEIRDMKLQRKIDNAS